MRARLLSPFWLPIWFFLAAILVGTVLLHLEASAVTGTLPWLDSVFTATSAVCVTGLVVVDTGSFFSVFGQSVILGLIQLGGLGIMTYTSLVLFLLGRRVSLTDRMAVGQTLLRDPSFKLGRFLRRVVVGTLLTEVVGATLLLILAPGGLSPYCALFHAVSAFCNAGFSLFPDSLTGWRGEWGVCLVFMVLITMGGLGFYVLNELVSLGRSLVSRGRAGLRLRPRLLSRHTKIVLETSLVLALGGAALIFLAEYFGGEGSGPWDARLLEALFQSVTCRTAGFNTVEVPHLTNVSLSFMLALMFIGGSPGSCAGGVKTTTARVWLGFVIASLRGRSQTRVGGCALSQGTLNRAFTLIVFGSLLIALAALILNVTEGGDVPHFMARGHFLEILFEVISAFGTVGLSTGLTPKLSAAGKAVIICMMLIGRLGPVWLLSALQSWQEDVSYRLPEEDLPLG
ncbi:MAG: potassium transporter TrkG [Desulfovibrionaceae bacterium]|nr:potassium transporter TrkG [Desulfovibrionaceae bacterium]